MAKKVKRESIAASIRRLHKNGLTCPQIFRRVKGKTSRQYVYIVLQRANVKPKYAPGFGPRKPVKTKKKKAA